jgi:hypothetical protein
MHGHMNRRSAFRLSTAVGLGVGLAACAGRAQDTPAGGAGPDILMFIRHGEEPGGPGGPAGVTQQGQTDPRSLSVRGWTRAGALATLFDPRDAEGMPLPTRPELARPTMIFAPDPRETFSRRSLETATPLASALNLRVDTRFIATQTTQLAEALSTSTGAVLIVWKHEQIDDIISRLSNVSPAPSPWPRGRYDLIYLLSRDGAGWRFTKRAQMLLSDDQPA